MLCATEDFVMYVANLDQVGAPRFQQRRRVNMRSERVEGVVERNGNKISRLSILPKLTGFSQG